MKDEKDRLVEQSESQRNPFLARPEDFEVGKPGANTGMPGHGQHGDTVAEERALLASIPQPISGRGQLLPTEPDHAGKPNTP